jgi:lipopolysaccharide transport system ATP-binding protein
MSDTVIQCEGIGKRYRLGQRQRYRALRDTLTDVFRAPFRGLRRAFKGKPAAPTDGPESIWALKDISFEIRQGEVLGIVGRNGAGKSTLLKVLARITAPTEGKATIHGRTGALLEVGTGFHPELTGRENIYLNGAILGMTRSEIERSFEEIVTFSECGRFLDTPIKHYSSGMYLRLAFSVAAHLETEILFVDEVLAVGDAAFQKKCMGKMEKVSHEGRTIIFVSHNLLAVQTLCPRTIYLDQGKVVADGSSASVISAYLQAIPRSETEVEYVDPATAPGNHKIRIHRARVHPAGGNPGETMTVRTPIEVEIEYWNLVPGACIDVGFNLYNQHGIMVFSTGSLGNPPSPAGLLRSTCAIPGDLLNNGVYRLQVIACENEGVLLFEQMDVLGFGVGDAPDLRGAYYDEWPGVVRPNLLWNTELVEKRDACDASLPVQS